MAFAHLHVHSCYSFLDGASSVAELLERAAAGGITALALTDHDTVAGAVDLLRLAPSAGIKPIVGAEVSVAAVAGAAPHGAGAAPRSGAPAARPRHRPPGDPLHPAAPPERLLPDGRPFHLVLLAMDGAGYANLCRLLTRAHLANPRGRPLLLPEWLEGHTGGLIALSGCRRGEIPWRLLRGDREGALAAARFYRDLFGPDRFFLELQADQLPGARRLQRALRDLAAHLGVGLAATGDVHYADRSRFWIHDLLTCVRLGLKVEDVHPERRLNAENDLKPAAAMRRLFAGCPQALRGALAIAERCGPPLELGRRRFPPFPVPGGRPPDALLRELCYRGAEERYGRVTAEVRARLEHELGVIARLGFAGYFLLVWDVVRWARQRGIRCAGRGSAADSAVAYCLHITDVDPVARGLLFERFLSEERGELPDIDVDFDWRRRDEVARYVQARYGEERVAGVCTYHTYQGRAAFRDFGKALGFEEAEVDRLARRWYGSADHRAPERFATVPELRDSGLDPRRLRRLLEAAALVRGFPRHLGSHLGGLVIADRPLTEIAPLQRAAKGHLICPFDKRAIEHLGLLKLDLLPLRTLGAIGDAVESIRAREPGFDEAAIPLDDEATYARIRRGDTVGVFQLESPAQRALHPRLQADRFEDLVASVALIRPGPIQGDMVTPFLRRRRGEEPVAYADPRLEPILAKTYGVVLYQEQVIALAVAVAGFGPGEADELRRVMTHARSHEDMAEIGRRFVEKATARGVRPEVAEEIFGCIKGYASYGFSEAHAAAFARHAYVTAYLLEHYPAEYYAALLSHQPMGYYPPRTLALQAALRGVAILPPDVNRSEIAFTVEELPGPGGLARAIRIGLGAIAGCSRPALDALLAERRHGGPFRDLADFLRRAPLDRGDVERLVLAGALDAFDPDRNRRRLLWRCACGLAGRERAGAGGRLEDLPDFSEAEKWRLEYELLGIDAHRRPFMAFFRDTLRRKGYADSRQVAALPHGAPVRVAGLPIRPHRPPTRSGRTVAFLTLEDEYGLVDVTVFEDVYRRYGGLLFGGDAPPLAVHGRVERRDGALSVVALRIADLARVLGGAQPLTAPPAARSGAVPPPSAPPR